MLDRWGGSVGLSRTSTLRQVGGRDADHVDHLKRLAETHAARDEVGARQPLDLDERARRRMLRRNIPAAHLANDRHVFRLEIYNIQPRHHDIVPRGSRRSQGQPQIFKGLLGLPFEIALAHHITRGIDSRLAGDMNRSSSAARDDVGPAMRFSEGRRVDEFCGHELPCCYCT